MNNLHDFHDSWDINQAKIIDCKICGFKHLHPIPSWDELNNYYSEKYYREHQKHAPFDYSVVNDEYIKNTLSSIDQRKEYSEIFDKVHRYRGSNENKMIDIGCGHNLLIKFFSNRGWHSYAIELSNDASKYLQKFGATVLNIPVEQAIDHLSNEIGKIGFINAQFILEHLQDPYKFLFDCHNLLADGGVIRIAVPNDFSEGQLAYRERYNEGVNWAMIPDHINYFNYDSLTKLLNKIGFKEVYRTTTFPLEFLLMAGINYYSNPEDQAKVNPFVTNFETTLYETGRKHILDSIYENLANLGLGRSIIMYAVKE